MKNTFQLQESLNFRDDPNVIKEMIKNCGLRSMKTNFSCVYSEIMFIIISFFQKLIKGGGGWQIFQKLISGVGAICRYSRAGRLSRERKRALTAPAMCDAASFARSAWQRQTD